MDVDYRTRLQHSQDGELIHPQLVPAAQLLLGKALIKITCSWQL